ncbi:esterase-like activity of phytase family protein [Nocardioides jishulii]|uniref:Esterase-like activity of phytase family protein n=1 Tax=Nocardioides jishulii TaxID=2575440 RepID=A0A4U2YUA1_9ACTN|nr:esterase-like activity of phytase family protein [Nocardioides jishulii]QCX28612.1 esterase-like activity of phytase family protein [Nocardioides jishulii]TKI64495.1 esterase-like activity of phytase family protein [Nocardioides jishulii]
MGVGRAARWRAVAVTALVATPFVVGTASADEPPAGEVAFRVSDHRIVESSGLTWVDVDGERWIVTVNDSGDSGQVFTLDPATGETVGVTTFEPNPRDVEALAPAGEGDVWVADIGDNRRARASVTLTRVSVGPRDMAADDPETRTLRYPDRARDAETLLAHPRTGRLYVVTKGALGGRVMEVPEVDAADPETMRDLGQVPAIITDGAFLPSGDHVLLRNYTRGYLLTFPEWEVVEQFELPRQPQGEGLTVLPEGDVLLSTEGRERDVLRVELPGTVGPAVDALRSWWQGVWTRWSAGLTAP